MLKTTVFKIQINCPGCNTYHTATRIAGEETCQHCGKIIHLSDLFGTPVLGGADRVQSMNAFLTGTIQMLGAKGGMDSVGAFKMGYTTSNVYCEECHVSFTDTEVLEAIQNKKPLICNKCEHPMPIKATDETIAKVHPKVVAVINDSSGVDVSVANTEKEHVIVFGCMTCGSGLQLSKDTGRTAKCSACGNENYLPDVIWNKLHPSKEVSPLFVITDIEQEDILQSIHYYAQTRMVSMYEKHFRQFVDEYFQKPFENDAVKAWFKLFLSAKNMKGDLGNGVDIEKVQQLFYELFLAGYDNQTDWVKEITAKFGNAIPNGLQIKLAEDKNEEVRLALSKNRDLHKEARKKLEDDTSPAIKEAAVKNKKGFFGKLFG